VSRVQHEGRHPGPSRSGDHTKEIKVSDLNDPVDEDAEGHGNRRREDDAEDAEGHGNRRRDDDIDDAEGHGNRRREDDDDAEGNQVRRK
jgi:hypothetical protein